VIAAKAGLPDGIFAHPKSQFWYILKGLEMEKMVYMFYGYLVFCGDLEYLTAIWYICWRFVSIFSRFGILYQKIWQP
jgi:hypothetical protein